jgi:hypothetical protein
MIEKDLLGHKDLQARRVSLALKAIPVTKDQREIKVHLARQELHHLSQDHKQLG